MKLQIHNVNIEYVTADAELNSTHAIEQSDRPRSAGTLQIC